MRNATLILVFNSVVKTNTLGCIILQFVSWSKKNPHQNLFRGGLLQVKDKVKKG